jgi:hypothetical protein
MHICTNRHEGARVSRNALRGNVDGRTRKDLERIVDLFDFGNQLLLTLNLRVPAVSKTRRIELQDMNS